MIQHCPICDETLDQLTGLCPCCRGWRCPVCGQPAYRDESITSNALIKTHMRCDNGVARPRPLRMGQTPVMLADPL